MKRRTLLQAGLAGALALSLPPRLVHAATRHRLTAGTRVLEVNGKAATVFGLTGPDGKPGLVLDQDQGFHVTLDNSLSEETLIHWHGLTPPWAQDGMPNMPAPLLKPGERRDYDFDLARSGTNWMHAHTLQEQALLAAPLIIRSREDRSLDAQEVVVLLHDFSFRTPEGLLEGLTGQPHGHGMDHSKMDHSQMDHSKMGHGQMSNDMDGMDMGGMNMGSMDMGSGGMDDMPMAEQMTMPMDLNDIDYDAYLANDRTLDDPEVVTVEKGGVVRLRVINAAASTAFTLDLGALEAQLIAVDGQPVTPMTLSQVPLTMAQRADLLIRIPREGGSFPVLALREGTLHRTGIILRTAGAAVVKLPTEGTAKGPVLDLGLETRQRAAGAPARGDAARVVEIDLTGNMQTYRWGLKGADGLRVRKGEVIEIGLTNRTMMAHPMHLHGHHFQVVEVNGARFAGAMRDTLLVPPMQRVRIAVHTDNPGTWAFHCHHLYHMVSGMMAFLTYEDA